MGATLNQKSMQCFYTSAVKLKGTTAQGPGPKGLVFRKDACVCVNQHVDRVNYFCQCCNAFCFLFMNGSCNTSVNLYLTAQKKNALKCPHEP